METCGAIPDFFGEGDSIGIATYQTLHLASKLGYALVLCHWVV